MNPNHLSSSLRSMAARIESSSSPSKSSVVSELRRALASVETDLVNDVNLVKKGKVYIREYKPVGPDSPYPTIDGRFEFTLPNGQECVFDGRLDPENAGGTLTCDGQDVSGALTDSELPDFYSIDESLDPGYLNLESVLMHLVGNRLPLDMPSETEDSEHD